MHSVSALCCSPEPSVTWKRNGRVVQGGRYIVQNFESELIIKKVQQSDEGEYVCSASNAASSRSEDQVIYVDVQGTAQLFGFLGGVACRGGKTIFTLMCRSLLVNCETLFDNKRNAYK